MFRKIPHILTAPVYFAFYNLRHHLEQTALLSLAISLFTLIFPILLPVYLAWGYFLVKYGAVPKTGIRDAIFYSKKITMLKFRKPTKDLSLTVFQTGKIETGSWGVYEGPSKPIVMDQPVFLIKHPKGLITFEAGIHSDVAKNPSGYSGAFLYYGGFLKMEQKKGQNILSQFKKNKVNLKKIKTMYISHLHPEHGGAISLFPKTEIAVDKKEYDYAFGRPKYNYFKKEYESVKKWKLLDFSKADIKIDPFGRAFDIFNDGSVLVIETPGHTPGSISMIVNLPKGPVFLVGDIAWRMENIHTKTIGMPFVSVNAVDHRRALGKLIAFIKENPKVTIVPTHDLSNLKKWAREDIILSGKF